MCKVSGIRKNIGLLNSQFGAVATLFSVLSAVAVAVDVGSVGTVVVVMLVAVCSL